MNSYPQGATTAIITPFKDGKVDEQTYAKLIQRQIKYGIDTICPVGTTGESATLSHDEHKLCIEIAVDVCKNSKTKVLAGAGSNATHEAIDIALHAQKCGADAIFSVSPYYNKPSQEGLYQHYKAIASAVDIPVMLYNVPGRTGVDIAADTVIRLFRDIENIYGIKEATGSIERCVELLSIESDLVLLSGDDPIDYPLIANGAKGITSVTANLLPDQKSKLTHLALQGDFKEAKAINDKLYDINRVLFCESNPIPIKAAMHIAGLIPTLEYRLPLVKPNNENMKKIEDTMKKYEIKGF